MTKYSSISVTAACHSWAFCILYAIKSGCYIVGAEFDWNPKSVAGLIKMYKCIGVYFVQDTCIYAVFTLLLALINFVKSFIFLVLENARNFQQII